MTVLLLVFLFILHVHFLPTARAPAHASCLPVNEILEADPDILQISVEGMWARLAKEVSDVLANRVAPIADGRTLRGTLRAIDLCHRFPSQSGRYLQWHIVPDSSCTSDKGGGCPRAG
jgi:hypothetical protein